MPWCAHCRRNVSATTENLHRKHAKRPRLVASAVQAFRLSEKVKKNKPKRKTENASSSHADPPAPTFDMEMEGYFEHDEMVDDGAPATDIEPHPGLQNTQVAIWPNGVRPYQAYVEDADSDDEDGNISDGGDGSEGFNGEDGEDIVDVTNYAEGLSAWDQLGVEFEQEAAASEQRLSDSDMALLRAFALKVESHMTDRTFAKLPQAFPNDSVPTIDVTKSRVQFLSGVKPVRYHCCVNSCCCFVGPHEDRVQCPYCGESRYQPGSTDAPRKTFAYIPLIPRLIGMCSNAVEMKAMRYRAYEHKNTPGKSTDVFDGNHYCSLLGRKVEIDGQTASHTYFSDSRDIAFGLATDGFGPFKHRKSTAWPLILFNYNLGPEVRCHIEKALPLGVIPGPKKPIDVDSFQWPVISELNQLQLGVRAYDGLSRELFLLRAYLILVFGDIPAVSMLMSMKGHNGFSPCRMCKIIGVNTPGSRAKTLYVPLDRSRHPLVRKTAGMVGNYNPSSLPLRSAEEMLRQGEEVQSAPNKTKSNQLSRKYGIKGVPILASLKSLSFPLSFPYDFMHLIWENLVDNLIRLWTGKFKGLDEGKEQYEIEASVWDAIGTATARSGSTIPSAFGARPPNFTKQKCACSAETWSFWTQFLGPVLLRRKFRKQKYYNHFVDLVKLITICLQFELSDDDIQNLEDGFIQWVNDYEDIYYQHNPQRVSTCPVTIHALLHIAPSIRATGPVWASWAFPIERFCGSLLPGVKSRRFPYASLDRHVTEAAQLLQIKLTRNLSEGLQLQPARRPVQGQFLDASYPTIVLLPPHSMAPLPLPLFKSVSAALGTRYDVAVSSIRPRLRNAKISTYAKVRRVDGGDTMYASSAVHSGEDSRDATYVRYEALVDKNKRFRNLPVDLEPRTFFGQLRHIIVVELGVSHCLSISEPETVILAAIQQCKDPTPSPNGLDMHHYVSEGCMEVVDMECVQCVVARVKDPDVRNGWVIFDRSGNQARAVFAES